MKRIDKRVGLFIGTDKGLEVLSVLIREKVNVVSVLVLEQQVHEINNCTQKIIDFCSTNNIDFKTTKEIKPKNYYNYLVAVKLDVLFVVSWRFLIPKECFSVPSCGIFILHDSLLPEYRGFAPTNWVIINQEKETGATLCHIHKDFDSGDIVDQVKITIEEGETAKTLNDKFLRIYPDIILKNLEPILAGKSRRFPQDNSSATYANRRTPEDGRINFNRTTKEIVSLIRGLTYPYPGAFCYYRGKKIIIWEAEEINNSFQLAERTIGKIVKINDNSVDVLTTNGALRIKKIGLENGENTFLNPKDFLNSVSYSLD